MSFWNLSDGNEVQAEGNFDANPAIEPIPDGTTCVAALDSIQWEVKELEGVADELIEGRWVVLDGEHKNRKVYQKLRVLESDMKKADKAVKMLAAIDKNAGGGLMKEVKERPTDDQLAMHLLGKPMLVRFQVWEMNNNSGNWVSAVAPSDGQIQAPNVMKPAVHSTPSGGDIEQDIPF